MIRLILYIILIYLIFHIAKKVYQFFNPPKKSEVKGNPKKKVKTFDPEDIEDIDYEEVENKNEK